ncbi:MULTISPECIES: hypothetical protein [unclassified Polaromonas]|uniref:hypothetical protein n=1 Tax=unclassified Polaromonas TaxID=2638319 RepID=UPI000BBB8B6C|nr:MULTISPECIES: hypothetical protein [unclassified Polaromonas]MDP2451820.1 hypothetical protein [Polaromonas sp.]MDP3755982.1 hypothetical protein [Polaromonas sp.]MDP3830475.1 hypothetical protein [Ignavibacteriaceae bacterium]
MSTPLTATLLANIKREAKRRAKASSASYNATLDVVARELGFASWHAVTQGRNVPVPAASARELPVDPALPPMFDFTPNEDRPESEIERWWLKPFAVTRGDGTFDVRCLDGGAHDRSTWYGTAKDLASAKEIAAAKLANWLEFLDRPIVTMDADSYSLTIGSLHPRLPRAVLATFESMDLLRAWLAEWEENIATHPERTAAALQLARQVVIESDAAAMR